MARENYFKWVSCLAARQRTPCSDVQGVRVHHPRGELLRAGALQRSARVGVEAHRTTRSGDERWRSSYFVFGVFVFFCQIYVVCGVGIVMVSEKDTVSH